MLRRLLCALGFHQPGGEPVKEVYCYGEYRCTRPGCDGVYVEDWTARV